MTSHQPTAYFAYIEGSPQAAENPPHDARWRLAVATAMHGFGPGATEIGLDFELEPGRVRIDLDNMVRLAFDGLRDAGVVARGVGGVEKIVATKRPRTVPGLGISLAWDAVPDEDDPFDGGADLLATSDTVPREESPSEKLAWRDVVAAVWSRPPVTKAVGVDIAVTTATSLAAMLKPVIDGLEPYLGRELLGRGTLRPRDEQVTWLRISRIPGLPVGLRVRMGEAPRRAPAGRSRRCRHSPRWTPPSRGRRRTSRGSTDTGHGTEPSRRSPAGHADLASAWACPVQPSRTHLSPLVTAPWADWGSLCVSLRCDWDAACCRGQAARRPPTLAGCML